MVDYWLDNNVLIEGRNGPYDFELAPRFWTVLDEKVKDGLLASPEAVYDELSVVEDDLAYWARDRRKSGMFVALDASVQDEFNKIYKYVEGHYDDNQSRRRFLDKADLWIIAHPLAKGGAVVTHERGVPDESAQVRIPNICEHFGVVS